MTGLTFYFNDNLVPLSNKLAEATLRAGIGSSFSTETSKDNIMFSRYGSRINASTKKPTKKNNLLTHIFYASHYEKHYERSNGIGFFKRRFATNIKGKYCRFNKKIPLDIFEGSIVSMTPYGQTSQPIQRIHILL